MKNTPKGRTGDVVKCVNGHHLYRLTGAVVPGSIMESSMFDPIGDAPKPKYGHPVEKCHVCGLPWIIIGPNGGYVMCNLEPKVET